MSFRRVLFSVLFLGGVLWPTLGRAEDFSFTRAVEGRSAANINVSRVGGTESGVPGLFSEGPNTLLVHPTRNGGELQFVLEGPPGSTMEFTRVSEDKFFAKVPAGEVFTVDPQDAGFRVQAYDVGGKPLDLPVEVRGLAPDDPRYAEEGARRAAAQRQQAGEALKQERQAREQSQGLIPCTDEPCTLDQLIELAVRIFNWLLALGGIVALLAVIVAGIRYLVGVFSGESGAMAAAKENLTYAIIGLAVLLLAFVIVRTIYVGIFGGTISVPGLN